MTDICDISYKEWPLKDDAHGKVCALLEEWALDPTSVPANAEARRKALVDAGLELRDNITKVDIHRMVEPDHDAEKATLNLVLPVPCQLRMRHEKIAAGESYGLPDAFTKWVNGDASLPDGQSEDDNLKFYRKYFCEYVLQHCG